MSAVTLPSPRTPVVTVDAQGVTTFSRAWFLFFQAQWLRTGGAAGTLPTGPAGPTGATGAEGPQGAQGPQGEPGSADSGILTTPGDLLGFDIGPARVPVGLDGEVLTADSTQALGLTWAAAPGADFDATGWRLAPVIWGGNPASVYGGVLALEGGDPATDYAGLQPLDASDNNLNGGVGVYTEIGIPGPQGPQGVQGRPATNMLQVFEFFAALDGAQGVPLPYPLGSGWYLLCINGMRQAPTDYAVSTTQLTLPAELSVLAGDLISFEYYTPTI